MRKIGHAALKEIAVRWDLSKVAVAVLESDNAWQQRARLLQIRWARERIPGDVRAAQPAVVRKDHPWRFVSTHADPYLGDANFLTQTISDQVRLALLPQPGEPDRVIEPLRLRSNLLSSQPLCFNAFGELSALGRLDDATSVLGRLWPDLVGKVTGIRYEYNPHRGPEGLIGTESAFDVFVDCLTPAGDRAFVGIEVKYHEAMNDTAPVKEAKRAQIRGPRLKAMERSAAWVGCDLDVLLANTRAERKVWQVWMDHTLALAMLKPEIQQTHCCFPDYVRGAFVMLSPAGNSQVLGSFNRYADLIADAQVPENTLRYCTLEEFVATCSEVLRRPARAAWIQDLHRRYLDIEAIESAF